MPVAVALIAGYITAHRGQSKAVQQTLLTAAQRTVDGLNLLYASRVAAITNLAADPDIIAALREGGASQRELDRLVRRLTVRGRSAEDGPSVTSLYGPSGERILTTDPMASQERLDDEGLEELREAQFRSIDYSVKTGRMGALVLVPVLDEETGKPLGFVTDFSGVDSLLRFSMGYTPGEHGAKPERGLYEVIYLSETEGLMTFRLDESSSRPLPVLVPGEPHAHLHSVLAEGPDSGSLVLQDYKTVGLDAREEVLLAYQRVSGEFADEQNLYLAVYRPTSEVFSNIRQGALLALAVCIISIAVLCVVAYRGVHNNIVRPVSLLNEGAQIVRQGDFDLKLKISTGDEIEELASSFNQMAVALKGNIQQLGESERKYRNLVTSMRDGIYQTDLEGNITFLNPCGVEILGAPGEEGALGRNMGQLFEEASDVEAFSEMLDLGQSDERSRIWMKRWDDRTICVELSRNRVYDDTGSAIGTEGIFRDVTESVRLEEEARERSERISAINQIANVINSSLEAGRLYESLVVELKKLVDFDYAAVALLTPGASSFDGRQLWPDHEVGPGQTFTLEGERSCAAWVARERKCLVVDDLQAGQSVFADQFPDDVKSCLCVPLYATGRTMGTLNLGNNQAAAFSVHDVEVLERMAPHLAVAIRNAQLLFDLQLSLEDVTRAREKMHEANEKLKTLDEMKTNLLSNVSHELRTPLVSVMGYTDMIASGKAGPVNSTQQDYLQISLRNIEKLVTLIENLLDFSRLHRGDERLIFDMFDLVDCARTSIQIIKPVADSRDMTVELNTDEEPILVEGDREKMGQVFNNLLSNAVKFNKNGGEVLVEMKVTSGRVEVTVSDTGIGIPPEALERVFTRFYQYDASSTRKYGGTGIGLSIAQDIARLHGSSITVSSEVGEGSAFRFQLTLVGERDGAGEELSATLPSPEETHLLVELVSHDRALSIQVRSLLATEGTDMIHASTLDNAITLAQKHTPDCILVDVAGNGNGRDVLDDLLHDSVTGSLPIIMLTNDDELYEQYRALVAARVKRSFRKSSLLSGIHHALSQGLNLGDPVGDKVLCVDDDPEILVFMQRCLEGEGFTVESCASGEEAIERVASREFGLILLDIAMPGMDGWETCRRIRSSSALSRVTIYMVTAKPIDSHVSLVQDCGADGFLLKPFRAEDLVELARGLELRSAAPS